MQGSDWDQWFEFKGPGGTGTGNAGGHNVNNAQGLKSSAVWYLFSGNASMKARFVAWHAPLLVQIAAPTPPVAPTICQRAQTHGSL